MQRAYHIISDSKKEANLLSYEIQVGLRASKGAYVSKPLIIRNIYFEEKNYIISCKPHNIEGNMFLKQFSLKLLACECQMNIVANRTNDAT